MNTKVLTTKLRNILAHSSMSTKERRELADFLDNLPTIPPKYRWDGTMRAPKLGEYRLDGSGKAVMTRSDYDSWHCIPILRKIEPEFSPGEIVVDEEGDCRVVDREGKRHVLSGDCRDELCVGEVRTASEEDIAAYLTRHPHFVGKMLMKMCREKYGGDQA